MINIIEYFQNVKKGEIKIVDNQNIEWVLGNMILSFGFGAMDITVVIYWKNRFRVLTHFHADFDEIEEIIKEIDCPNKVICVTSSLVVFGETFAIIDKSQIKKQNIFRHYSI